MSYTIQDIINRAQPLLDRLFKASQPAAFLQSTAFAFIADAYAHITSLVGIPRAQTSFNAISGTQSYALPTDIFDGINGIISLEYLGRPLTRVRLKFLQDLYAETWKAPPDLTGNPGDDPNIVMGVKYFCDYEASDKVFIVAAPGRNDTNGFVLTYRQLTATPTALTDAIPMIFNPFVRIIPLYIAGRCMEFDKQARGAALIDEFEGRVLKQWHRSQRSMGRQVGTEAYTQALSNYRRTYVRRRSLK